MRDQALHDALQIRGMVTKIAEACSVSTAAVSQWRKVPKWHLDKVVEATGIPASKLRADLYHQDAAE